MKRFYVMPLAVLHEKVAGREFAMHKVFEPHGSTYLDLGNGMILLHCSDFASAAQEKLLHEHPKVAHLQHPTKQSSVKFSELVGMHGKKFEQQHLDALASLGVQGHHTLWDLHDEVVKRHPAMSLVEDSY